MLRCHGRQKINAFERENFYVYYIEHKYFLLYNIFLTKTSEKCRRLLFRAVWFLISLLFCFANTRVGYKKMTPVKREKLIAVLSRLDDVNSLIKSNHWWYNPCCPLFIVKWTSGKNEKIEKLSFPRRKKLRERIFPLFFLFFSISGRIR